MFNLWISELQDIMEIKNMHKSKKSSIKLQDVVKNWYILSLRRWRDWMFIYNTLEKITDFKQVEKILFILLILIQTRIVISGRTIWPFVWNMIHMEALFFPINGFDISILWHQSNSDLSNFCCIAMASVIIHICFGKEIIPVSHFSHFNPHNKY